MIDPQKLFWEKGKFFHDFIFDFKNLIRVILR